MRDVDLIPAIVFGALLGALLASVSRSSLTGLAPGLIASATTIIVGWWIHKAVRRRGELDRIPIEYLSKLNHRIDARISACLESPEQITNFTLLSNEIHWQIVLLRKMRPDLNVLGEEMASRLRSIQEASDRQRTGGRHIGVEDESRHANHGFEDTMEAESARPRPAGGLGCLDSPW